MTSATPLLHRADRVVVRGLAALTLVTTTATVVSLTVSAFSAIVAEAVSVTLLLDEPIDVDAGTSGAAVVSGSVTAVDVVATGLSGPVRGLLAAADIAQALTVGAVGFAIGWMLWKLALSQPFARSLSRTCFVAGAALTFGPLLVAGFAGIAAMQTAFELAPARGELFVPGFTVEPGQFALPVIGLAVLGLGLVFRRGAQLQRDTEGLV